MIKYPQLHAISTGHASLREAAQAFEALLVDRSPATDRAFYEALRDWTWKALHSKRLDAELGQWRDLIEGVRARLPDDGTTVRAALRVLSELVGISIHFAGKVTEDSVASYSHVPEILQAVAAHAGPVSRQELKAKFNFSDSRLSQLLSVLVHSGHLDREPRGRTAEFIITARGRRLLEGLRETVAAPKPDTPRIASGALVKVKSKRQSVDRIVLVDGENSRLYANNIVVTIKCRASENLKIYDRPAVDHNSGVRLMHSGALERPTFTLHDKRIQKEKILVAGE